MVKDWEDQEFVAYLASDENSNIYTRYKTYQYGLSGHRSQTLWTTFKFDFGTFILWDFNRTDYQILLDFRELLSDRGIFVGNSFHIAGELAGLVTQRQPHIWTDDEERDEQSRAARRRLLNSFATGVSEGGREAG